MIRSTTVCGVHRGGVSAICADGQVTMGESVVFKQTARKVYRIGGGSVVCGIAGSVADAQSLLDRLEGKLDRHSGDLKRSAVEFAKEWRSDRFLRRLEAMMVAADKSTLLVIGGDGNVLEPDDGVAGIGSGGGYALAAARTLVKHSKLSAEEIAQESVKIAAGICVYTNDNLVMETVS